MSDWSRRREYGARRDEARRGEEGEGRRRWGTGLTRKYHNQFVAVPIETAFARNLVGNDSPKNTHGNTPDEPL